MARRLNPITGEWEDDQMLVDTSVDLNKAGIDSAAAMDRASKALQPGEYLASGPATPGKALTNSPAAAAVVNPDIQRLQQQVARQQADALKAQAAGATPPQEMQKAVEDLNKLRPGATAKGEATPWQKAGGSQKTMDQIVSGAFTGIQSGMREIPADFADNAAAQKIARQRNPAMMRKYDAELARAKGIVQQEVEKAGGTYQSREQISDWIRNKSGIPVAYQGIVTSYFEQNAPDSVRVMDAAGQAIAVEKKKISELGPIQREEAIKNQEATRQANLAGFRSNLAEAKKIEADQAVLSLSLPDGMENKTGLQDKFKQYYITGDSSNLSPGEKSKFDTAIKEYEASRRTRIDVTPSGFVERNLTPDEVAARNAEARYREKGEFLTRNGTFHDGGGMGKVRDSAAAPTASVELKQRSARAEKAFNELADHIGVSANVRAAVKGLSGYDSATEWNEMADRALGIDPSVAPKSGVAMDNSNLQRDIGKAKEIISEGLIQGKSVKDPELWKKLSGLVAGEKSMDAKRIRLGQIASLASAEVMSGALGEWNAKADEARRNATSMVVEDLYAVAQPMVGKDPLTFLRSMNEFINANIPNESALLDEVGKIVKVPSTIAEERDIASKKYLFAAALMAKAEKNEKNTLGTLSDIKSVLAPFTSEATYDEAARANPQMAGVIEKMARDWSAANVVAEEKVALQYNENNKKDPEAFKRFIARGGGVHMPDPGNPDSAMLFVKDSDRQAFASIPAGDKDMQELFLSMIGRQSTGEYGNSDTQFKSGVSTLAGDTLAAKLNKDESYWRSRGLTGSDLQKKIAEAVDEQMQPSIEGRDKQPTFKWSASMLSDDKSDLYRVSTSVKNLYDKGYELAKKASPYGRDMMEAALYAAHMERQYAIMDDGAKQLDKSVGQLFGIASNLAASVGAKVPLSADGRTADAEKSLKLMSDYLKLPEGVNPAQFARTEFDRMKAISREMSSDELAAVEYYAGQVAGEFAVINSKLRNSRDLGGPSEVDAIVKRNDRIIAAAKEAKRNANTIRAAILKYGAVVNPEGKIYLAGQSI